MPDALRVRVEVLGDVPIDRLLLRWESNSVDLSDSFREALDQWALWTKAQFRTRGQAMGTPWRPLKAETIAAKRRNPEAKTPTVPLVLSGGLRKRMTVGVRNRTAGAVRDIGTHEAAFGTTDPVAMFHHGRDRSASNPVPRRPIFELDEARRRITLKIIHRGVFS